jgi:phage FluMu protein Com
MARDNLTVKVRAKCPHCGNVNEVYVPKDKRQLKRISNFLKKDVEWKGKIRCVNCMKYYHVSLLDDFV